MTTPEKVWDTYHKLPSQDLYPYSQFLRYVANGTILEIGVRDGVSTAAFLLGLKKNGGHLYSVDIEENCGKLFDSKVWSWEFIHADSMNVGEVMKKPLEIYSDPPLDILYVDGNHSSPFVDNDIFKYAKYVKPGGMILVHDIYPPRFPNFDDMEGAGKGFATEDVRRAYHQFIRTNKCTHFELPGEYGMGVIYLD